MVNSYSNVITRALLKVTALATLLHAAPLAQAEVDHGSILEAYGWFSRVHDSRDLWLTGGNAAVRVNLDDFGGRRPFVCERLLSAGERHVPSVYGVLRGDELKVATEFYSDTGAEQHGYVEVSGDGFMLGVSASLDRPDTFAVRYRPGHALPGDVRLPDLTTRHFRRALALARDLERARDPGPRQIEALGRFSDDGKVLNSDATFIELRHGPERGASVAVITGDITPSPFGVYVVTKSGHRLHVIDGPRTFHQTRTLIGVWSPAAPQDLRVLKAE